MSDKKKILIIQNIHQTGLQLIKNNPKYEFEITDDTNLDNLKKKIIDCDAISIRTAKLPSEVIEQGKKLKIISRHGVGYDNIDLNSSKKNNITIQPYNSDVVILDGTVEISTNWTQSSANTSIYETILSQDILHLNMVQFSLKEVLLINMF